MVNIQVYNEENKKIETVRCEENETMANVHKLEDKYGETQETRIERDDSKKTPMIRYHLTTEEGYTLIVSMSIYQAERVNDYLTTYEAFAEVFTEEEVQERKATAPKHRFYRISQYRPNLKKGSHGIVKNGQWSQKCTAQGVEYALAHMGYNGRMVNEEITEIVAHFDENGRIGAIWVKCSDPKYDWDRGYHSFMVHYRPRKFNYELTWEERDEEAHQELVKFLIEADKYFKEEGLNVKVRTYDRKRSDSIEGRAEELTMEELISSLVETPSTEETEAETEESVEETIETEETEETEAETEAKTETEEGSEKMTEKTGYDRDIVLLETGEFECDGRTFHYEGKTIFVADVLKEATGVHFTTKEGYKGCLFVAETHHILCRVHIYSSLGKFSTSYHSVFYAPNYAEIYSSATDFVGAMTELLDTYYDKDGSLHKRAEYSSYKGRLYKELAHMTESELEAIDEAEADEISLTKDAYNWVLNELREAPTHFQEGVEVTEEMCFNMVEDSIRREVDDCEEYKSPSVTFYKVAETIIKLVRMNGGKDLPNRLTAYDFHRAIPCTIKTYEDLVRVAQIVAGARGCDLDDCTEQIVEDAKGYYGELVFCHLQETIHDTGFIKSYLKDFPMEKVTFGQGVVRKSAPLKDEQIENCISLCRKELDINSFFMESKTGHTISGDFLDSLHEETISMLVTIYAKMYREDLSDECRAEIEKVYARVKEHWELERKGVNLHKCIGFHECGKLLDTLEGVYLNPLKSDSV